MELIETPMSLTSAGTVCLYYLGKVIKELFINSKGIMVTFARVSSNLIAFSYSHYVLVIK